MRYKLVHLRKFGNSAECSWRIRKKLSLDEKVRRDKSRTNPVKQAEQKGPITESLEQVSQLGTVLQAKHLVMNEA